MNDSRVATVPLVDEANVTGEVADIFADIKRTKQIDFVPRSGACWRRILPNWKWSGRA